MTFSRNVLPEPITTVPGFSGMWTCCGMPPRTAPSETRQFSPNVVPLLIVTWLSKIHPLPIRTPDSITHKGPMWTSAPRVASGLTNANGWICMTGTSPGRSMTEMKASILACAR